MVHKKNRLLSALIAPQTRNSDNTKWEVVIGGVFIMILIFIIVLLCDRVYHILCCRMFSEKSSEKAMYVKILSFLIIFMTV